MIDYSTTKEAFLEKVSLLLKFNRSMVFSGSGVKYPLFPSIIYKLKGLKN
jgi:hypothetical protein